RRRSCMRIQLGALLTMRLRRGQSSSVAFAVDSRPRLRLGYPCSLESQPSPENRHPCKPSYTTGRFGLSRTSCALDGLASSFASAVHRRLSNERLHASAFQLLCPPCSIAPVFGGPSTAQQ